jgi:hypothetical protein
MAFERFYMSLGMVHVLIPGSVLDLVSVSQELPSLGMQTAY